MKKKTMSCYYCGKVFVLDKSMLCRMDYVNEKFKALEEYAEAGFILRCDECKKLNKKQQIQKIIDRKKEGKI